MDEQTEQTKSGGSKFLRSQFSQKIFLRGDGDPVLNGIIGSFSLVTQQQQKDRKQKWDQKRMILIVTANVEKKKRVFTLKSSAN